MGICDSVDFDRGELHELTRLEKNRTEEKLLDPLHTPHY